MMFPSDRYKRVLPSRSYTEQGGRLMADLIEEARRGGHTAPPKSPLATPGREESVGDDEQADSPPPPAEDEGGAEAAAGEGGE